MRTILQEQPDQTATLQTLSEENIDELIALLLAYETFLKQNKRADMAGVYEEAVKHQDWCPIQSQDCWTELPRIHWSPLQRRLIDSMPGGRLIPHSLELSGVRYSSTAEIAEFGTSFG